MDEKYDQELKDFSLTSDYQEQYDDTTYENIDGEPSHLTTFDFQWNFKCSRGVMLRFSYFVLLVNTLTYFSYPSGSLLSQWTFSHHI